MSRASIRTIILFALISIIGIVAIQVYWMQQALSLQEKQFDHRIRIALYGAADELISQTKESQVLLETINRVYSNYYTIDFSAPVKTKELEQILLTSFQNQNLNVDFEYGIFDCTDERILYGRLVKIEEKLKDRAVVFDLDGAENYYIGILFPTQRSFLLNQINIWIFFTAVLLLVILFFTYTIWTILKHRRLSEVKNDFINNMTHEFKTPISTIALSSEVLLKDNIMDNPERFRHYVKIINEENKRLKGHVESVLQIALFDNKKIGFNRKDLNINDILQNISKNMQPRLDEKSGNLNLEFMAQNPIVSGDENHLTNVFYNILDNAIKYCDKIPEIRISTINLKKYISIEISDNGKGMKKENSKQIFEKFYRVPSGNVHDVKGFGIGLFYVKQIVDEHKGKIKVKSVLGKGTIFRIYLPTKQ
ncbi:MAG: HAMP domain-containing histidine kinase [Bacteroidetes bacterium]|nr:HAMP domain-containing histidine kinase [Bacteroidota bacterium]MBK7638640.1 HAMP domain-containing histidine kinase [Bacteroidota bacterium]MBK8672166.1 HAMP domain-containing histidine kinase [Bacteroidota bacterium]MBK9634316.1 HAMP domain-containing histidine kinase [Bacteroidota bacterium]MBL0079645.1 HAMP domain-containing histidine kinase [Bacteroidota bacterium]